MDLNDAERYAVAALFTLALHSTHVETGVDKDGNSLSESDIAWGCPSEELFDEQLLSQVPLKLPPDLLDIFWGFDCMAPAGLAPRLYAWLKIPRKAWPGLLRMPDLAGCAGSPEAVEAFVTLVRRYSAFLDPELAFTTGQASRLQQHFCMPATVGEGEQQDDQHKPQDDTQDTAQQQTSDPADPIVSQAVGDSSSRHTLPSASQSAGSAHSSKQETRGLNRSASVPASEAVAAAAASLTAAALAAGAEAGEGPSAAAKAASEAHTAGAVDSCPGNSAASADTAPPAAAEAEAALKQTADATGSKAQPAAAASSFEELHEAVDMLPKEADEGTVVPTATFTPAEQYKHTTSHKAVLALYEVIGGCLASNTEPDMDPLFAMAAQEAETAAFAAAAARGNKKALQKFKQQQLKQQEQMQQQEAASSLGASQQQGKASTSASGDGASRPAGAWFPAADDEPSHAVASDSKAAAAAGAGTSSKQKEQQPQQQEDTKQQPQQQQLQGLASIQWYDARGRVAVKRVAHWLRVPWPQVRAFETMWCAQALSLEAAAVQPRYSSSSRAMQYLKVGAAAVGGGALLAVTGGLAAPAIAAGLGAAVTLAHGGAAVAAAVTGFAGSTAGTAAVTGLFGAWGASVSGGSAKTLYSDVTEFGFWDLSQSIYVDGKGPQAAEEEEEAAAAGQGSTEPTTAAADGSSSTDAAASASQPSPREPRAAAPPKKQQQQQHPQQHSPQQTGFLQRLFSKDAGAAAAASSSSSAATSSAVAAKATTGAAAAAGVAAVAAAPAAATAHARSPPVTTPPGSQQSSPTKQQLQPQPQLSPTSSSPKPATGDPLFRKSPLHMLGWGSMAAGDDDDGPEPQVRTKAIKLRDSAFNTDSDEDADEFYDEYLNQQGPHGQQGPQGVGQAGPMAQQQQRSPTSSNKAMTPSLLQQQQQQHQEHAELVEQQQEQQQQEQQPPSPAPQGVVQQQVQHDMQPTELTAVEVQDDPLSSREGNTGQQQHVPDSPPAAPLSPRGEAGAQQQQAVSPAAGGAAGGKHQDQQQEQLPGTAASSSDDLALAAAAAAAAAAGTATAAAAAAAKDEDKDKASSAPAGSSGVLSGLFSRKAPPAPVYVPLLLTPINPKHRDETRIALTIAINGCCIESIEDYVRPWKHLPSRDCDRFALVWESACLKELGRAVVSFLAQQALQQVAQRSIQALLYTGLVGALALPMTLCTAMRVAFGSKWLVALRRAQAAGKMLAMQLAQGCHGGRPVTLIGCSMGARLVFHCLLELERLGLRGCVENAILLGAPVSCRPDRWCAARSVVAGRLINGYSVNDWTLGLLYRVHSSSSIWLQAAGMYRVEVPGVENINLSRLIAGHQDYLEVMDDILEVINLHDA